MSTKTKTLAYQSRHFPIPALRLFWAILPTLIAALISVGFSTVAKRISQHHERRLLLKGSPHYDLYTNLVDNIPAIMLTTGILISLILIVYFLVTRRLPPAAAWIIVVCVMIWCVAGFLIGLNSFDIS